MRKRITAAAIIATVPLALSSVPAMAATAGEGTVSVLHAVPGLTVDVYANGDELIPDFEPGTLTDPLQLPAGTYDLAIYADGEGPDGEAAIEAEGIEVEAGANATIVAHPAADGTPTATVFANDTSDLAAGQARVTARHVAAAPEVDVRVNETPTFEALANPNEATADVDAGSISADVVLAGTDTVAIGPADLELAEGTSTIVYAWGSAEDENLEFAVQTIDGLHGSPDGVPGGEAGLVPASSDQPWMIAGIAGVVLLGASGVLLRRRSARVDG